MLALPDPVLLARLLTADFGVSFGALYVMMGGVWSSVYYWLNSDRVPLSDVVWRSVLVVFAWPFVVVFVFFRFWFIGLRWG